VVFDATALVKYDTDESRRIKTMQTFVVCDVDSRLHVGAVATERYSNADGFAFADGLCSYGKRSEDENVTSDVIGD